MTINLNPDQVQVLIEAVKSGLAKTPNEGLDQALEVLKESPALEGIT
jgi:hypothetical protein